MTLAPNSSLKDNAKHHPDERAQDNAKATDSWLSYLSQDLGRAFRRGKDEIDLLVDSTRSAFHTTKKITERMAKRLKLDHNPSSSQQALSQEFDSMVSGCPDDDHLHLRYDEEFRQLVKQLHSLSGKFGSKAAAREEDAQEKTLEVSHERPAEISHKASGGRTFLSGAGEVPGKEDAPEGTMAKKPEIE